MYPPPQFRERGGVWSIRDIEMGNATLSTSLNPSRPYQTAPGDGRVRAIFFHLRGSTELDLSIPHHSIVVAPLVAIPSRLDRHRAWQGRAGQASKQAATAARISESSQPLDAYQALCRKRQSSRSTPCSFFQISTTFCARDLPCIATISLHSTPHRATPGPALLCFLCHLVRTHHSPFPR